tara:strand:+ start:335 stop:703 length:369 start_codon:yes stop_codon:yes gene_type:complete
MKNVPFNSNTLMVAVIAAVVSSVVSTSMLTGSSMRRISEGSTVRTLNSALERQERMVERQQANQEEEALHGSAGEEKYVRTSRAAYRACVRLFKDVRNFELSGRFHNCLEILQEHKDLGNRF